MRYFKEPGLSHKHYRKALKSLGKILSSVIKKENKEASVQTLSQIIHSLISTHSEKNGALETRKDLRLLGNSLRLATQSNADISYALREIMWGINADALHFEESGERSCFKEACRYLKSKNKASVIFDIGANKGEWSKEVIANLDKFELHLFEPNKSLESELIENIKESLVNSSSQNSAHINMLGIGDLGTKVLFVNNSSNEQASTVLAGGEPIYEDYERLEIEMTSGSIYCRSKKINEIDFLKIDTEGTELKALESFDKIILDGKIRFIQFEYGSASFYGDSSLLHFFRLLDAKYSIHRIFPEGITEVLRYSEKLETFEWSNFLAIRKDSIDFLNHFARQNPSIQEDLI